MIFQPSEHPHRRYNPLLDEWVLVSPHRAKRPWLGQTEATPTTELPQYDPGCYLCPGNTRANGETNPDYQDVFVFNNDFPALLPDAAESEDHSNPLFIISPEQGINKVICFSPRHDLTLAEMDREGIERVVREWKYQYIELGKIDYINHVQIFENKGAVMGCSNPHPHGQIWAQSSLPTHIMRTQHNLWNYWNKGKKSLLQDYLEQELKLDERIVYSNEHFVVLVPFWAVWPYETMIISRRHLIDISEMEDDEIAAFADALKIITVRYDNLFKTSFPYSAGIHQSPTDGNPHPEWHFHMHFYPPLLRSATVRKFMVGYEMLGEPQRDITPEQSAKVLRELPDEHYKLTISTVEP